MIIESGDKYNKLTAIRFVEMRGKSQQYWLFHCDCGNEKVLCANDVKRRTKSCGCFQSKGNFKHGMKGTRTYASWKGIKERCLNKNCKDYKNYGGRGITICPEWLTFENFYNDMGKRPIGLSIDRINNNGNYCKENCHWATIEEQANNKRTNHLITYQGKTQTLAQWEKELEISRGIIRGRLKLGWSVEKALTLIRTPH